MSKYKVRDKVLVEAEIVDIKDKQFKVKFEGIGFNAFLIKEEKCLIPASKTYEKEKDEIKVGDVVIDLDGDERVVLHIDFTGTAQIFSKGGVTKINKEHLKKTGRHIDIEHLLEQIRRNE